MKKKIFEIPNLDYLSENFEISSINDENSEFNKLLESLASS